MGQAKILIDQLESKFDQLEGKIIENHKGNYGNFRVNKRNWNWSHRVIYPSNFVVWIFCSL